MGTLNSMPPDEWHSQVLCTSTDNLWMEFGPTVLQCMVDFTKVPAKLCIIITTPQESS